MKVFNCIQDWQTCRKAWGDRSVGFVPTMGALHDGHRSLVDRCVAENQHAVVSIFVNPTQFDQAGDLAAYPSTLEQDLDILSACGVGAVLLPEKAMIYPDDYRYRITENGLSERFCGAHRPGHFDGVLTVVMKLLNIVRPRQAYFGGRPSAHSSSHLRTWAVKWSSLPLRSFRRAKRVRSGRLVRAA